MTRFGYRFLADEAGVAGQTIKSADRVADLPHQRLVVGFGEKRGKNAGEPGPPVRKDLVEHKFAAALPDQLWLIDIAEHWTDEGKLYLCAIKGRLFGTESSATASTLARSPTSQ